jgi:hypothetical protein
VRTPVPSVKGGITEGCDVLVATVKNVPELVGGERRQLGESVARGSFALGANGSEHVFRLGNEQAAQRFDSADRAAAGDGSKGGACTHRLAKQGGVSLRARQLMR